jgi:hypothetical protein
MSTTSRLIYESSSGDQWLLARDSDPPRVYVRHIPNPASGGRSSTIGLDAFLARELHTPQHQALLALIAALIPPDAAEN